MSDISELIQASSGWLLTVAAIVILLPLERRWPKLAKDSRSPSRNRVILALALASLALALLFQQHVQTGLISALVPMQITSIAKWPVSDWVVVVVSFLLLDLLHYLTHRLGHLVPTLWRLHSIHHSDKHVTALTGLLHHPLEFIPVALFVLFFSVVLGLPILVYIMYGFAAALHNAFSHSEVALPVWLDRSMRWLVITPDMHRTHHSIDMAEGNSNFGAILSVWDWLFGTYTHSPATGEENLVMGLEPLHGPRSFSVLGLLAHPFRSRKKT